MALTDELISHYPQIYRLALRLCRNAADAEDLTQDTLMRALRHVDAFDGQHVRSWLFKIVRSSWVDECRRRNRGGVRFEDMAELPDIAVEDKLRDREWRKSLRKLPKEMRVAIVMHVRGATKPEISARLGVNVGTIKSRIFRGLEKLRDSTAQSAPSRAR